MSLPTNKIMLRSPYHLDVNEQNLSYVIVGLRMWLGEVADEPTDVTVRLRTPALDGVCSLEISDIVRDYIDVKFYTNEESNAVLVSYEITKVYVDGTATVEPKEYLIGFDGYGTFTDGANYSAPDRVLMSTDEFSSYTDTNNRIPVLAEEFTGYKLQVYTGPIGGYVTFRNITGLTAPTSTEDAVKYINTFYGSTYADRVIIQFATGQDEIVDVQYQECNKYGVIVGYFVNRFGVIEQFHFTGRFNVSMESNETKFKRNIRDNDGYNVHRHQEHIINKNGKASFELNTGWIPEKENDTIIEMIMSEQVWLQVDSDKFGVGLIPQQSSIYTIPVQITSKNHNVKSKLNEKLINYNFKFSAANDWINSVR